MKLSLDTINTAARSGRIHRLWQPILIALLISGAGISLPVLAASFTIVNGQVVTTQQTLNSNETGTIEVGGQLNTGAAIAINNPSGQNNITVLNNGAISTTGGNAHGIIILQSADAVITNNGAISTTGGNAFGITSVGANAVDTVITSNGSISTTGDDASGIGSGGADAVITNSGAISTTGDDAHGILSGGADAVITNNGAISTTGDDASGIGSTGANAVITNSGALSTMGDNARGINSTGANAVITNNGALSTTGDDAYGINSQGANAVITNNGALSTMGDNARGINSTGANGSITHSGTINVTGTGSQGVVFTGTNSTLTNSGTISASGNATSAIRGGGGINTNTLNLQTGSQIIGTIDLGDGVDSVNVLGMPLASAQMTFANAENITLAAGLPGLVNGNVVTTVDPTGQSIQGTTLNQLTSSFHNVISQRMAQTKALPPIQLAALELSPGMLFQQRAPIVWGEVFGSHRKRGDDGLALAYTHDYKGFTGGYERDYKKGRLGLFAGFADADVSTDITSIATDTDSFFGGVYGHWYLGLVNLTTTLSAGFEDHDNERIVIDNLAGTETAQSDFTSVFFSPSLTLSSAYTFAERFELRPSATLTYNVAWYEDYNESGTTRSNLSIDDRSSQTLNGRLQLAVAMALNETSEFELRSGFTTRHSFDSDTNASLSGTSFSYASAGDDSVYGGFVGGNLRFNTTDKLDVIADVEYREANGDEDEIAARLRFEYRF